MELKYVFIVNVDPSTYETEDPLYIIETEREALRNGELDYNELFDFHSSLRSAEVYLQNVPEDEF